MPRNSSGIYTLPEAPFVPGTVITASAQNSNFSDIATALTESVATSGVTPMTGPLRAIPGSDDNPSYTFRSNLGTGIYSKSTNVVGAVASRQLIWEWSTLGLVIADDKNISVQSLTINGTGNQGFSGGNIMLYTQTNAPLGWTKVSIYHDRALRVVNGATSIGGTLAFVDVFKTIPVTASLSSTTITEAQMPTHFHTIAKNDSNSSDTSPTTRTMSVEGAFGGDSSYILGGASTAPTSGLVSRAGGGQSHTHTISYSPINLNVKYTDIIVAIKDN